MQNTNKIKAAMDLILDPIHLKLEYQSLYDGIGEATKASVEIPAFYGYNLWTHLIQRGAYPPALDQTIDRLPPAAFGRVTPSIQLVILMKEWATFNAPNLYQGYLSFKQVALEMGWKPSQVNSYLIVGLRMEEMMMGAPFTADSAPDFSGLDASNLNVRERAVVQKISTRPAHP